MADLTATTVAANFNKHVISQSDAGHELVISVTRTNENGGLTDAALKSVYNAITLAGGDGTGTDRGGPDAFTVAGLGTADGAAFVNTAAAILADTAQETVYMRVQGSGGTFNTTTAAAGVSNLTVAVVAHFKPAL
jgi:hypothetical protein